MAETLQPVSHSLSRARRVLLLIGLIPICIGVTIALFGAFAGFQEVNNALYPARNVFCCDTPANAGIDYEEVSLVTSDGLMLVGWYLMSAQPTEERALILAHGLGGNRVSMWDVGFALHEAGYGVLLLELRAHGESEGQVFTRGWLDIQAAADWLEMRGVEAIGAYGFSLGAVMAIQAAASTPTIDVVIADGASPAYLSDMPLPNTLSGWLYGLYDLVYWTQLEARIARRLGGNANARGSRRDYAASAALDCGGWRTVLF